jgi:hypothetical protein
MKKRLLAIAFLVMGITLGTQAADQYLGDGVANPILATGASNYWDSVTANWLSDNTGTGTYGTWTDGNVAFFIGSSPQAIITNAVVASGITRPATASGRTDVWTAGAGQLTLNGTIDYIGTGTRQFNLGGVDSQSNTTVWAGSINMGSGINRLLLTGYQTITPGSSITAANSVNDVRLSSSLQSDYSNLSVYLTGADIDNRNSGAAANATLGYLEGTGRITANNLTPVLTVETLNTGGSNTVGALTGGNANLTFGSGTHLFDISTNGNDRVGIGTGAMTYGGTLKLLAQDGKTFSGGETFNLFDAGSFSGSFSTIDDSGLGLVSPMTINYDNLVIDGTITVVDGTITNYTGDLYLGDGTVYTNLTGDIWTTNTAVWGVYAVAEASAMTNWIDNSDVFIIGSDAKTISLQSGLDVSVGTLTWQSPEQALTITGDVSSVITITNKIRSTSTKQVNVNNWLLDGDVNLENLSRLNFSNDGALTPGSSLSTDNGSDIQLAGSFTDLSSNPINLGGNNTALINNTGSDVTLGTLNGRGALKSNTNSVSFLVDSYNIGGDDVVAAIDNDGNANIVLTGSTYTNELTVFNLNGGADRLGTTGTITFGGDLVVVFRASSAFAPRLGDVFNLFDYSSYAGSFNSITLPALSGDLVWHNNIYTDGTIEVGKAGVEYNRVVFTEFNNSDDFQDDVPVSSGSITNADGTIFTLTLSVGAALAGDTNYTVNLYGSDIAGLNGPSGVARLDSGLDSASSSDDEVIRLEISTSGATLTDLAFGGIEINSFAAGEAALFQNAGGSTNYINPVTGTKYMTPADTLQNLESLSLANSGTWYLEVAATTTNLTGTAPTTRFSMDDVKFIYAVDPASSWAYGFGLSGADAAPDYDYDGDGLTNIEEYGLGGNPTNALDIGYASSIGTVADGGSNWFEVVHAKRSDPNSGITYDLETTEDLVFPAWTNGSYTVVGSSTIDADFDAVTNRTPVDVDTKFTRLIIE